jgi:thiol-disulfide isomerase/thioredoxin
MSADMNALFTAMDLNGDGFVTPEEITECLTMLGAPEDLVKSEVDKLMTRDLDKDTKLNKKEFTSADYSVAGKNAQWLVSAITARRKAAEKKKKFMAKLADLKGVEKFEFLLGPKLLGAEGKEVETKSVIDGKEYVAVYMSAHWCPPCRRFTPLFAEAYKKIAAADSKKLATIFVSADRDADQFKEYFGTMPWNAVPFEKNSEYLGFESRAGQYLDCQGIPKLGIFDKDGNLVSGNGVQKVYEGKDKFLSSL